MENKLFNPVSNIIHECVKLVGVADTILCLQRVVGTFMIEDIESSEEPEDAINRVDHKMVVMALDKVRYNQALQRIDRRTNETE